MLRLHGVSILLVCVVAFGWGAAGAATPKRAVFKVTLTGTLTKNWTVKRTVEGDCTKVATTTGQWRTQLGTRRQTRIGFTSRGRGKPLGISPAVVRAISGSASQSGTIRIELGGPRCPRSIGQQRCARRRASFRGATVRLTTPRVGVARFARLQGASAARSFRGACPEEPADIRALRTDLGLADAPLSAADVFARNVPRFFISGDTTQETTIEGEYDGKVIERVRWTLTFTRVS